MMAEAYQRTSERAQYFKDSKGVILHRKLSENDVPQKWSSPTKQHSDAFNIPRTYTL